MQRVRVGCHFDDSEDRPEYLLARDAHLGRYFVEERRLDEQAVADLDRRAPGQYFRLLLAPDVDVTEDLLVLLATHDRAEVVRRVEWIPGPPGSQLLDDAFEKRFLYIAVDNHARVRCAVLAHVPQRRKDDLARCVIEAVGIVQYDCRILAAAFEHDSLQVTLRRILKELAADLCRTSERDDLDVRMTPNRFADLWTFTWQDVQHAIRNAGLRRQLGNFKRGHAGLFGGLDDHAVTGGKRRPDLPGQHHQWKVPGQDAGRDACRLPHDESERVVAGRRDLVVQLVGRFGVPFQAVNRLTHVSQLALADRLATVEAFEDCEFMTMTIQQLAQLNHALLALARMHARPDAAVEGLAGFLHGEVDILSVTGGDFRERRAGRRIDGLHPAPGTWLLELAVDERVHRERHVRGDRLVFFVRQQVGHVQASVSSKLVSVRFAVCTIWNTSRCSSFSIGSIGARAGPPGRFMISQAYLTLCRNLPPRSRQYINGKSALMILRPSEKFPSMTQVS